MKINTKTFLHDSLVVIGRNIFTVLWRMFLTGLVILFLVKVTMETVLFWVLLIYCSVRLLQSIFEMIIDYLDTVLNIRRLSDYRQSYYQRKIRRFRNARAAGRKKAVILMPYQTTSFSTMPQVMLRNNEYDVEK